MRQWMAVIVCSLLLACGTSVPPPTPYVPQPGELVPDFVIKKIEHRCLHRQQVLRRTLRDPVVAKLEYEFTIIIENIGDVPFDGPFYLSASGSLTDYQERLYSRHIRLNDERQVLEPGRVINFIAPISFDSPGYRDRVSHYPVRFYINTEGSSNSTGFPTLFVPERNYRNNFYELQIRL
ncbi:MAG: hypothetical protein FJ215_06065 [Ignavibacteria bacterium]|nr:hypothetical protein [Ignavibacteria bacterium]